jgi:hypothetical protein
MKPTSFKKFSMCDVIPRSYIEPLEDKEHREWRLRILKDHEETKILIDEKLREIRKVEEKANRSISESRRVRAVWNDYSDNYNKACKKLKRKILKSEERQEYAKFYQDSRLRIHNHHLKPTKCFIAKKQRKYTADLTQKPHFHL